jgi:hypothetical protein
MKHPITAAVLLAVALMFSTAPGAKKTAERPLTAESRTLFEDQSAAIRQQVERNLQTMGDLLARHTDAAALAERDKAALLQAQENVNAILTRNDGRRLICERSRPTGSHLGKDKCVTFAERERQRRLSEVEVRKLQMKSPGPSGLPNAAELRGGGN